MSRFIMTVVLAIVALSTVLCGDRCPASSRHKDETGI